MKRTSSGFVLYFDDLDVLRKQLDPGDALDVITALALFAQTGQAPSDGDLSPAAAMAYEMMARRVSKSLAEYADKKAKTSRAARARWNDADACKRMQTQQSDADASESMQTHADDADACKRMQMHGTEKKRTEKNKEAVEGISSLSCARGGDGSAGPSAAPNSSAEAPATDAFSFPLTPEEVEEMVTEGLPRCQRADDLVLRYKLPDCDTSREALLEDFETYGERAVEDALRDASLSNSRPMLSVKYYRKVLENSLARGKPPDEAPAAGNGGPPPVYETRDGKDYCDGMEIVW